MRQSELTPQFFDFIPNHLENGMLYISEKYGTAIHKCCCGCGQEVVTPLSPAQWQIRRYRNTVTLTPSIGNWNFRCRSHYWIIQNRVEWAGAMTDRQIQRIQERDRRDIENLAKQSNLHKLGKNTVQSKPIENGAKKSKSGLWKRLLNWLSSL